VLARSELDSYSSSAFTEQTGEFTIGPVVPGTYRITATALGGVNGAADHPVSAGEVDVVVQLPATFTVKGLVVDRVTGEPCSARVTAGLVGVSNPMAKQFQTEKDGTFRMRGFVDGDWELTAYTDDARVGSGYRASIAGEEPCEPVVIRVSRGAKLVIRCETNTQIPGLFVYRGGAIVGMTRIEPGETVSVVVPPGDLTLHYWAGGREQIVNVSLDRAGDQKDLVLAGI
jgi:hypothetical protein